MFDLGAWVAALLAESGRKTLTRLVLGTEHERALRSAANSAVEKTAREEYPTDDAQAEQLVLVIGQVFSEPSPDGLTGEHTTVLEALRAGIGKQLAVLDDATLTAHRESAADGLGVTGAVLAETLSDHLVKEIIARGSRGGPLHPLADQLNHDWTHMQGRQTIEEVSEIKNAILEAIRRRDTTLDPGRSRSLLAETDIALHVEHLLDGLVLGDHAEAEHRANRLFLHLVRNQQRATVEALLRVATTTSDHTTQLLACSLLEAADRLDTFLVTIDDLEMLARSADDSLRSSAAFLMWQWAESTPGRVPISLLGRLALPSTEDWYVHAAARAGAKQLLLARSAARAVFDRMAASQDPDDRDYATTDLLEVAMIEPRAVPADLAKRLARDQNKSVAAGGTKLLRVVTPVEEGERQNYYSKFGL